MDVDYQKIDDLNARMTVRIKRDDYEPKYKSSLLEYRKKASLKGFRKGKTPFAYLEKLFGQEVLTRTVTEMLTNSVNEYLDAHEVPYIGQPLPVKDQEMLAFDPKELEDEYVYTFDIGLLPEFEIKGLDEEIVWHDVPVSEEDVEKEWQDLLQRHGTYVEHPEVAGESRVNVRMIEIEADQPKAEGKEHTRRIYVEMLRDEVRDAFVGKKAGDKVRFNPNAFLKQGDVNLFKRYYFDIKDEETTLSEQIEAEILNVEKLQPAEVNEELFNKAFAEGTVKDEDGAKELIRNALKQRNDAQSDAHLRHMIEHRLMDENKFELPHAFLDRLVGDEGGEAAQGQGAEEASAPEDSGTAEESDAKDSEKRADSFRWHFIRERLTRKFNIEVSPDEITRAAADQVYDRFGGYMPYDRMREIITRYLSDKDSVAQLRSNVVDTKLFNALKEQMPVVKQETSKSEFEAMLKEHRHEH